MDRRQFIKYSALLAGMYPFNKAFAIPGVMPQMLGGGGAGGESGATGSNWADWDEASEDTLSVDQDGDGTEDTHICVMENPVAGGDETGRGIKSGADLVWTQSGNVPGATGDPPNRQLTDKTKLFTSSEALGQTVFAGNTWLVGTKWTNLNRPASVQSYLVFNLHGDARLYAYLNTTGTISFYVKDAAGTVHLNATTVGAAPTGTDVWVFIWSDGTVVRGGWALAKPTKWSDFGANNRVTNNGNCSFATWANGFQIGRDFSTGSSRYTYYGLLSTAVDQIIDNAA